MRIKFKARRKKPEAGRPAWLAPYRWAAVGTLLAYSASGTRTALAQSKPSLGAAAAQTSGALPAHRFDIPPESLDAALKAFTEATGVNVKAARPGILTLPSAGVSGLFTVEQALQKLLAGTGLNYTFSTPQSVTVDLTANRTSIDVTTTVSALENTTPKYSEPILDTPQTINEIPRQIMDQEGVTTLRDALRNTAGLSLAAGEGGAQGDSLTIRGFTARNDLFLDGMRDFGSYYRDPFNTQEVEVLEGPSSVTSGRGSTGGVVEQSSKSAGLTPFISGDATIGTDLTRRITFDIDQPLPMLGKGAAFRLNVMGDENNVAERDVAENRRFGAAPTLALGLGTATRWTFSYLHENEDDNPDYGIPWLLNGAAPVPRQNYYGFQNGNYLRTYDDIGTSRVEHDVNKHITMRDQLRYANYIRDVLITEPQIVTPVTVGEPLSDMVVTRHEIGVNSIESLLDEQLDATIQFQTGFLKHKVVTGIEATRETSDPTRPTYTNVPTTSLLDPDPNQAFAGTATITSIVHTAAVSEAAYALDTIGLGRHWDLTGGFRWDRFDTNYLQSVAPASAFDRIDIMPSWKGALVYKPVSNGSIYIDAGTSFNPSAESLSLSAATANLPPEKNKTYEAGSKWEFDHNRLSLNGAVFRTVKTNAREPDPDNPLLDVLAGTQRVDGAEITLKGRITNRWQTLASYARLDSEVVSSQYYPAAVGYPLANVPKNTFNMWNTFHLPWHWEAGLGGNYVSSRTASATVPLDPTTGLLKEVPGYWVFNAMAKHPINERLDLQINVNNIANRYYYDELHPAHIVLGPGRSALIGVKFKF